MAAKKCQQQSPQTTSGRSNRPLAESVFCGEARLRELEHLAETARRVRDQAAAELTRTGSVHHIARDRIAAAERMLRKANQEIAELRAQLGPSAKAATAQQSKQQDFELAVLLGHSKARFATTAAPAFELQADDRVRQADPRKAKQKSSSFPKQKDSERNPFWRTTVFGVLIGAGIGVAAIAGYAALNGGSIDAAAQTARTSAANLLVSLRRLLPLSSPDPASLAPVPGPVSSTAPDILSNRQDAVPQTGEQQARAAAEERLVRRIAGLKKPQT